MATNNYPSLLHCLRANVFVLAILVSALSLEASTIWNGPNIGFFHSQANGLQDTMTSNVRITRGASGGLYNSLQEAGATATISPKDTKWVVGTLASIPPLASFGPCPLEAGQNPPHLVGTTFVVYLVTDDIYLQLTLTNWGGSGGFGDKTFGYTRSTAAAVSPSVTITNPANNAVFAAPANVLLQATATIASGTVTNVTFRNNTTVLGSVLSSPFNFTANGLAAGSYAINAVATAGGVSATSAVVNISVVTPVAVNLTTPHITGGSFLFNYSANVGLRYVVERSSNLFNWTPIVTNVAGSNPASFSEGVINPGRFYRVGRLPNP
jgi:hypothetical protein